MWMRSKRKEETGSICYGLRHGLKSFLEWNTMYKNDFVVILDFRDINRYIAVFIKFSFSSEKNDREFDEMVTL